MGRCLGYVSCILLYLLLCLQLLRTLQESVLYSTKDEFVTSLRKASLITSDILQDIVDEWQIRKYPNFLQSAAMTHTSWEVLKLKYQFKLLDNANGTSSTWNHMVISFMGSSVTAGHDSPFNVSFPILTQELLAPAFKPMKMHLYTRNAAMGNNPCMPCKLHAIHSFIHSFIRSLYS